MEALGDCNVTFTNLLHTDDGDEPVPFVLFLFPYLPPSFAPLSCTSHWNGTFNLIPLVEAYSKVFFSIINVQQQSWAQLNFYFAEKDAATQHFESLIKSQVVRRGDSVICYSRLQEYP